MTPGSHVASADGTNIAVHDFGGVGPTLLIVHATGLCAGMYRRLGSLLADQFRIVALDVRSHGESDRPASGDLSWDRTAEDVFAVREHMGAHVHAFGHSMGASSLLLAEANQPGLFDSLFLFEPIVFGPEIPTEGQNVMASGAKRRRATFATRDEALRRFASRPPFSDILAGFVHDYVEYGFRESPDGVTLRCVPDDESRLFEGGIQVGLDRVRHVSAPTVVAVGAAEEGPNPSRLGPPVAAALANGDLVHYPTLGHFGPFQDPKTISRDIANHITRSRRG